MPPSTRTIAMSSPDTASRAEAPDLRNFSGLLTLVGAGKMGGALLQGWLRFGIDPAQLAVIEPAPSSEISALSKRGVRLNPDTATLRDVAAIVVAVKPQVAGDVLPRIAPMIAASTVVPSLMAGRTLRFLAGALQTSCALVRAMPNTPAAIGRGITVAVPLGANRAQRDLAHRLLRATGTVEWIDDEALMDAVTAVSGSGPAYVFLLAEALARAGAAAGLAADLAARPRAGRAPRSPGRASCCIARSSTPPRCATTSPRRAARPQPRSTC